MQAAGRLFLCPRCRAQVLICGRCDRGQRYCTAECSRTMRRASVRDAGRRYQRTRRGRHLHAARARRYRARNKIVTHQGSPVAEVDDVVPPASIAVAGGQPARLEGPAATATSRSPRCCRCCSRLPLFVRIDFVRRRRPSLDPPD